MCPLAGILNPHECVNTLPLSGPVEEPCFTRGVATRRTDIWAYGVLRPLG